MAANESTTPARYTILSDDELLRKAKAVKKGYEFTIRFEQRFNRSTQRREYESRTGAALALLANLSWWSRSDRAQMRRLFERSALGGEFEEYDEFGDEQ